jgi:diguanylate cyclase (GGDEF)-like protein
MTSFDDEAMAAQAVHMGAQDYLVKGTLDSRSLARAVRYALERHRLLQELHELSLSDELTALANRRGFMMLAEQHLKFARRTHQRLLIFFIDLDGMKPINDVFGHSAGDRALVETANLLRETFRESDILARIGGDEFVAMSIAASEPSVVGLQTRLQRRVDARNARRDLPFTLSLSAGFALFSGEGAMTLEELMAAADADLYEKKRAKYESREDLPAKPRNHAARG